MVSWQPTPVFGARKNATDRGVHGVARGPTRLKGLSGAHTRTHAVLTAAVRETMVSVGNNAVYTIQ